MKRTDFLKPFGRYLLEYRGQLEEVEKETSQLYKGLLAWKALKGADRLQLTLLGSLAPQRGIRPSFPMDGYNATPYMSGTKLAFNNCFEVSYLGYKRIEMEDLKYSKDVTFAENQGDSTVCAIKLGIVETTNDKEVIQKVFNFDMELLITKGTTPHVMDLNPFIEV
jgi:hypothetical protein